MQDTLKIGAAALGGYVLGRTKKAKTAIGLALWLSGRGRPRDIARDQAMRMLQSDRAQELLQQMRGPMLSAGRQAAVALVESQAGRLTEGLQRRTDKLGSDAARGGTDTARRLSGRRRRDEEPDEEPEEAEEASEEEEPEEEYADEYEDEEADESEDEADEEDEEDEPEDEEYEGEEDEYADEDLEDEGEPDEDEGVEEDEDIEESAGAEEPEPEPEPQRRPRRRSRRAA